MSHPGLFGGGSLGPMHLSDFVGPFWAHSSPFMHQLLFLHLIAKGISPAPERAADSGSEKDPASLARRVFQMACSSGEPLMQGAEGKEEFYP